MNAAKKISKADAKLLARLQSFAGGLDILGCDVRIDAGSVYMTRRVHGSDDIRFHNVGRSVESAEWIEGRMKAIESEIE